MVKGLRSEIIILVKIIRIMTENGRSTHSPVKNCGKSNIDSTKTLAIMKGSFDKIPVSQRVDTAHAELEEKPC